MASFEVVKGGGNWNVNVARGDSPSCVWEVFDSVGAPFSFTGATVTAPIIGGAGGVTGWTVTPATGLLTVSLTGAQTTALGLVVIKHYLRVVKGTNTCTWLAGTLKVRPEYEPADPPMSGVSLRITDTVIGTLVLRG
jgi:hypothetical protein